MWDGVGFGVRGFGEFWSEGLGGKIRVEGLGLLGLEASEALNLKPGNMTPRPYTRILASPASMVWHK